MSLTAVGWGVSHGELTWTWGNEVSGLVLISVSVSSNDDWSGPSWNVSWDVFDENWLSEHGSTEIVSNGSIWRFPHLLEFELLNSGLIRGNGGALDSNLVLLDGLGSLKSDLVICGISVFDAQVIVLDVDFKVWKDQLFQINVKY